MARVEIPEVILGDTGSGMTPVTASVQVNYRNGAEATVYVGEFSETETTNPLSVSDVNGRVEGWVEAGSYDLVVTTESDVYTQRFEAAPGTGVGGELNIKSFGAIASTSDDDLVNAEAIQGAISNLPAGGGTIIVPNETFGVSSLIPITLGNRNVIFKGEGAASQLLNVNESYTSELSMFSISGSGQLRFEDLTIRGPAAIGVAGGFHVVNVESGFCSISFENCTIDRFNRIVNADVAGNWIGTIDFDRCTLTGYNSTGVSYSTFVYLASPLTGTRTKKVRVHNCFLSGFGSASDGTVYGISVPSDCDLDVYGNEWAANAGSNSGACIAVGNDSTVLAANASTSQLIHDNQFDSGILTTSAVRVSGVANPRVYNNDFANTLPSVFLAEGTPNVEVFGNKFHGTTGVGAVNNTSDGTLRVFRNSFDLTASGLAVWNISGTLASLEVFDNDFAATAVPVTLTATPTVYREWGNHGARYDTLLAATSATALVLPTTGEVISVTGTTTVTSMTVRAAGKRIVLVFAGVLTFTDGSNLKLAGDMVTSADDTIELISDGTNWIELGRSAN